MENTPLPLSSPKNLINITSFFANFNRRLFFNWLLVQLSSKKKILITDVCYCLPNWNFTLWKTRNSSTDITLMCEHLVCLQLKTFSPFLNPAGKPTFMIIINQMMDILWQTAASVANETIRSAWTFKLKFCEMRSTTCNRNAVSTN